MNGRVLASEIAQLLESGNWRLVLAESCTCGLVAATLGEIPGISNRFCGSAVTYREATKTAWLGVRTETLKQRTAVSGEVALQMACGVLDATPEADWSVSITGHLGPEAPPNQDGLVFIGVSRRLQKRVESTDLIEVQLESQGRLERRAEAVQCLFRALQHNLSKALVENSG